MLPELRCGAKADRLLVELDRARDEREARPVSPVDRRQVSVRHRLDVVVHLAGALQRGPHPLRVGETLAPFRKRALGEDPVERLDAVDPVLEAHPAVGKARIGDQLRMAEPRTQIRPVAVGLEHVEEEPATVAGAVAVDDGVGGARAVRGGQVDPEELRGHDVGGEHPHRRAEQRDVDDGGLAGALATEERGRDPAGDRHRAGRIPECRALHDGGGGRRRREGVGDAAPAPERRSVEAASLAIRPTVPLAVAAHVATLGTPGNSVPGLSCFVIHKCSVSLPM